MSEDSGALDTFPKLLLHHARVRGNRPAIREKDLGIWQTWTWREFAEEVRALACGLADAGLARGAHFALIGANRPRIYAAIAAAQCLGAIPVPLYQDAAAAEMAFPIRNAEVGHALAEDQEQVDSLLERGRKAYERDPAFLEREIAKGSGSDTAALFFTSGTTGTPKGVVLTYTNLIERSRVVADWEGITDQDVVLAFMPPAWIGQNIFSYAQPLVAGYCICCPESAETVTPDMREIGPSYYFAPPRVFEALLTQVSVRMDDASAPKRAMYRYFMGIAQRVGERIMEGKPVKLWERALYGLGELLVYGPLRNVLGMSRIRIAYTGGEAIGPDLFVFYRSLGVNLKQLYGSTETSVFVCIQPNDKVKPDTVGPAVPGVELKFTPQRELLIRSPGLFKEYYKNAQATAEVKDAEGWFHTGDAGYIDADGHLKIIDRAKDVGALTDGTLFAPKYLENKLKFFPYIKEAVCFGDGRDNACAFLNIDMEAVGNWAEKRHLPYSGYVDLASRDEVYALVRECVEKVNADLAQEAEIANSQIHRFLILHKELDADDEELTRTRKVRRRFIGEKYQPLIEALYGGKGAVHVEAKVKYEDGRSGTFSADLKIRDAKTFSPASAKKAA